MAVSALFSAGGRLCGSLESSLAFHRQFLGREGSAAILPQSSKYQSLVEDRKDLHNPQNPAINRALFLLALLLLLAAFWRGAFELAWVIGLWIIPAITNFFPSYTRFVTMAVLQFLPFYRKSGETAKFVIG